MISSSGASTTSPASLLGGCAVPSVLHLNQALLHYFLSIMDMGNKLLLHFTKGLLGIATTVCMLPEVSSIILCVGMI